jgi:enoyl-CoA hydratase/carnithine racemase
MELTRHGDVFVLRMNNGENRFNPSSVGEIETALDEVMATQTGGESPCALVTTGTGKFFSNGIDLDWMLSGRDDPTVDDPMVFIGEMSRMWARVMSLPIPTVAAVNGHAFAGGAMFSLAHDHVLMRADRGYWSVNEVLLRMRLTPGMQAILSGRLTLPTARRAILTAHRFDGPAALAGGIADALHDEEALLPQAIELAQSLAPTAHPILGVLKEDLHAAVLPVLRTGAGPAAF